MPHIMLKNLSFAYEGFPPVFQNVSLNLDTSWRLGLIGRNGRGKTTLLKILTGELHPDGEVISPVKFVYFPFPVENQAVNAYELSESLRPAEHRDHRLEKEASLLKLKPEALFQPFGALSGGEATKVLLSILFIGEDDFPLIDEPTQNLDLAGRKVLGEYLSGKKGFLLVSHDRRLLDDTLDHVLAIEKTGLVLQRGNYASFRENQLRGERFKEAENQKITKEIKRLGEAAQRSGDWASRAESGKYGQGPVDRGFVGHKAAKLNKRAKAAAKRREDALEAKKSLIVDRERPANLSLSPLRHHSRLLAQGTGLSIGYGDRPVLQDVSFTLRQQEILAVTGPNGAGKSLLIKLLLGEARILAGEFYKAENLVISHVPQKLDFPHQSLRKYAEDLGIEDSRLKTVLRHLGFEKSQLEVPLGSLSLGQRKKAALAASLAGEAHLYLWDEPLGHVDIPSRLAIEELLAKSRPTMVVVEHDRTFLEKVATDFLELSSAP
ncbi:MAG: ATP-binding cassette domain-containing protein [Deltaproteobacteria bacterium]|jgi:lincosamide and streptogramin A transport system ATP-binding/permease protein|nr:ATP-binding cassette domain-containing protein [Deltaproteobacteria bacterium]